jgi:predicted RNA-binding Zn-ribbon protein involved in translation (DUF1610 family)
VHAHWCGNCGEEWWHDDEQAPSLSDHLNKHACPQCGEIEFLIFARRADDSVLLGPVIIGILLLLLLEV